MAVVRRHWRLVTFHIITAAIGALWVTWCLMKPAPVRAIESPQPVVLDASSYSRVRILRERVNFTALDLATVGCNGPMASDVLRRLTEWYGQNKTALEQADVAEVTAQHDLEATVQQIHKGPRDAALIASLTGLRNQRAAATDARRQLENAAAEAVVATLGPEQAAAWRSLREKSAAALTPKSPVRNAAIEMEQQQLAPPISEAVMSAVLAVEQDVLPQPEEIRQLVNQGVAPPPSTGAQQ